MQNENPPPLDPTPPAQQKPNENGIVIRRIRRVNTTPGPDIAIGSISKVPVIRTRPAINSLEQGYSIVRISKFIEVLRDPTVIPSGAAIVRKISLCIDNSLTSKTFILHTSDIINERKFLQKSTSSAQSPILAKLGITSIEDDSHRYIVENLRDVGLGSANCLNPKMGFLIDRWKRAEFFNTRRLVENIEAIQKTPKGMNVIFEWQGGRFVSLPLIECLEKVAGEQQYLIHALRRAAGIPDPGLIKYLLPWRPELFADLMRLFRRAERQTSAILRNSSEDPEATVIGESKKYDLPIEEALTKFCNIGDAILEKTKILFDCHAAGEQDVHSVRIRNMRKVDKKVVTNIISLRKDLTEDRVLVSTMAGGKAYWRSDGIRVVGDQIDRNIRIISIILSQMGYPSNLEIPVARKLVIRRSTVGGIPGNRREFSTTAPKSHQTSREQGGYQNPSIQHGRSPRQSPRGPSRGYEFDTRRRARTPETLRPKPAPRPKLAPGESVRDKMAKKEKERLSAMDGLIYSLIPGDHQEGGSSSVQKVVDKESFQNAGSWESGGEAGGLTDESGIEPLRKGDMCEIR